MLVGEPQPDNQVPRDRSLDASLALLRDGYRFVQKRRQRFRSDIFRTRLMLQPAVCIGGEDAVRIFYDPNLFERRNALPGRVQKTLTGEKGVQTLDNSAHRHRKAMFMGLMGRDSIRRLCDMALDEWQAVAAKWQGRDRVVLFDEAQLVLCRAACRWAGIPLDDREAPRRAADLGAMVDAFGAIGPRHWRGRAARRRSESWIADMVEQARGRSTAADATALDVVALHRELDGRRLKPRIAAVELLNLLRPIVAIATYISFAALALNRHPDWRQKLRDSDDTLLEMFVHEVRRFYPFTPFLGARVAKEFEWNGYHFHEGMLVVLDVYGTNHDPQIWKNPEQFRPERFLEWKKSPFDFIPQGGGDHFTGHRCAGEWITIALMKEAVAFLTREISYSVPEQNLDFSLSRMPTRPQSGVVIAEVTMAR